MTTADKGTGAKTRTHRADYRIAAEQFGGRCRLAVDQWPECAIEPKGHGLTVIRLCDNQPWLSLNSPATMAAADVPAGVERGSTWRPRVLAAPDNSFSFNSDRVATDA